MSVPKPHFRLGISTYVISFYLSAGHKGGNPQVAVTPTALHFDVYLAITRESDP